MTYQQHVQAIKATMTQQATYALLKARDIATIFITK